MKKEQIIQAIFQSFPYPDQIKNLHFCEENNHVQFTWRDHVYDVSESGSVSEKKGCFLEGNDRAILAEELIKRQLGHIVINEYQRNKES